MRAIAAILLATTILGCTPTTTGQKEAPKEASPSVPSPPSSSSSPSPSPSPPPQPTRRPVYNLTGFSPGFKDGYIDGCETAKKTANGGKDEQRFAEDKQYRLGWNDGFSLCGRNRAEK